MLQLTLLYIHPMWWGPSDILLCRRWLSGCWSSGPRLSMALVPTIVPLCARNRAPSANCVIPLLSIRLCSTLCPVLQCMWLCWLPNFNIFLLCFNFIVRFNENTWVDLPCTVNWLICKLQQIYLMTWSPLTRFLAKRAKRLKAIVFTWYQAVYFTYLD